MKSPGTLKVNRCIVAEAFVGLKPFVIFMPHTHFFFWSRGKGHKARKCRRINRPRTFLSEVQMQYGHSQAAVSSLIQQSYLCYANFVSRAGEESINSLNNQMNKVKCPDKFYFSMEYSFEVFVDFSVSRTCPGRLKMFQLWFLNIASFGVFLKSDLGPFILLHHK